MANGIDIKIGTLFDKSGVNEANKGLANLSRVVRSESEAMQQATIQAAKGMGVAYNGIEEDLKKMGAAARQAALRSAAEIESFAAKADRACKAMGGGYKTLEQQLKELETAHKTVGTTVSSAARKEETFADVLKRAAAEVDKRARNERQAVEVRKALATAQEKLARITDAESSAYKNASRNVEILKTALASLRVKTQDASKQPEAVRSAWSRALSRTGSVIKTFASMAGRALMGIRLPRITSIAAGIGRNLMNIKAGFDMLAGTARTIISPVQKAIKAAFDFETARTAFAGLLNSIDKSKEHIEDLRRFAARTPLTFDDLQQASKLLLSFGVDVKDVMPYLKMLGDISMGNEQKFQGLALAFAQCRAAGRLMGQDLLQMINQGFNPLTIIAQKTGKSVSELRDIMSKGGISFEMVAEAMRLATTEGGLFNNAMENASQTGNGLLSTLQDNWVDALRTFGNELMDVAKGGIQWCINKFKELKESGTIKEWAEKARTAILTVVGAFNGLAESQTRAQAWDALKDVLIGGFEEAATGAGKILLKAAQAVGKIIGQAISDFNPFSENSQWKKEVKVAKELGIEGIGQWDWSHDNKAGIDRVRAEIARRDRAAAAKEVGLGGDEDGGESRFMRGVNALRKLGEEAYQRVDRETKEIAAREAADAGANVEQKANDAAFDNIGQNLEKLEEERKKAALKAEEELHKQRVANLKAEIRIKEDAERKAETAQRNAQTEFDRAFAMYRDPEKAAAQIAEERDYAADYKQLQKDASRYGGKWRIDELSRLMAAGDTQGQAATLEEWRKSSRFTPEVEAMVRAAAADKTKTTAEDELRKLNDKVAEHNAKLDQLLMMKGGN